MAYIHMYIREETFPLYVESLGFFFTHSYVLLINIIPVANRPRWSTRAIDHWHPSFVTSIDVTRKLQLSGCEIRSAWASLGPQKKESESRRSRCTCEQSEGFVTLNGIMMISISSVAILLPI